MKIEAMRSFSIKYLKYWLQLAPEFETVILTELAAIH
jgi:hypothetical protein